MIFVILAGRRTVWGIFFIQNRSGRCFHEKNARGRQIENVRRISRRSGFRRCLGKNKGSLKGKNVFWENIVLTQKWYGDRREKLLPRSRFAERRAEHNRRIWDTSENFGFQCHISAKKARPATFLLHFSRRTCTLCLLFFGFHIKLIRCDLQIKFLWFVSWQTGRNIARKLSYMELTVKLQVFEGPLDLLLHLLEKK